VISFSSLRSSRRRTQVLAAALLTAGTAAALLAPPGTASAAIPSDSTGMMCETPLDATAPVFNLDATTGYVTTPDGNSIYMWGYTASGRGFQLPGPTLCVESGRTVTVKLHNTLREATSIVFPGQSNITQQATGAAAEPAQPELDANGAVVSLVKSAPAKGGDITYTFTAGSPGTYVYQSGTDVTKQREMGLYGGLVVRPAGAYTTDPAKAKQANNDATSTFSKEFLLLVSQVDPDWHSAVERNRTYDVTKSTARYFLINGRSMPDTLAPNNAAWLPSQPYTGLIHITADPQGTTPATHRPALIRYANAGPTNYPFHPHGSSQTVVTRDGAPTHDANGLDASYGKFLLDVGPGQSIDALESWKMEYDPAHPIPSDIQLPQLQDQIVGPGTETWFSENPYLGGVKGDVPTNITQNNACGEYYHVAHSHALYQATNYGASFGGMMTLIRVDPPNLYDCVAGDYQ
jgi:FtsP/CotA-like multicopper oxidase with cupredoxin domain